MFNGDQHKVIEAAIAEMASIRRTQDDMLKMIEQSQAMRDDILRLKIVLSGADDNNGIRGNIREVKEQLHNISKRCDELQRYIWLGIGGTAVASYAIPILLR